MSWVSPWGLLLVESALKPHEGGVPGDALETLSGSSRCWAAAAHLWPSFWSHVCGRSTQGKHVLGAPQRQRLVYTFSHSDMVHSPLWTLAGLWRCWTISYRIMLKYDFIIAASHPHWLQTIPVCVYIFSTKTCILLATPGHFQEVRAFWLHEFKGLFEGSDLLSRLGLELGLGWGWVKGLGAVCAAGSSSFVFGGQISDFFLETEYLWICSTKYSTSIATLFI